MAKQPVKSTKKGASGTSPRQILMYVGIAVAVAAVLFAAFGLESDDGPSLEEVAGDPSIEGQALPLLPEGGDPAVGTPAPVVSGQDFDGSEVTIGDGEAELLVFMAAWCPACQAELPELVEWLDEGGLPDGVELTVVSTGLDPNRPPWPPQGWLERSGYDGPIIVDSADGAINSAYGMSATPFWAVVQDGQIVHRSAGQLGQAQMAQLAQSVAP